jgi:hypothetical protein
MRSALLLLVPMSFIGCDFQGSIEPDIECTRSCDTERADCEQSCETECVDATGDGEAVCDEDCKADCDGRHTDCSFGCEPSDG